MQEQQRPPLEQQRFPLWWCAFCFLRVVQRSVLFCVACYEVRGFEEEPLWSVLAVPVSTTMTTP